MNKVFLKGRLTNDPELRQTPNGVSVSKFTIAVNRRFDREKTDFINCEAWRNTAEFISKFFCKGKEIAVVGELHIDKSEKDGKTNYFTNVVVDEAEFCGNKADGAETKVEMTEGTPNMVEIGEDDLPF
jgi:single-strand DNA-binding protein